MQKIKVNFQLNGENTVIECHPMERLLDVLREQLGLTGTKEGCGEGECGACSVLVDDELVNSCLIPTLQAQGKSVVTIEGLTPRSDTQSSIALNSVQRAFLQKGGAQCGICTPGMVMASVSLLRKNAKPSREDVKEALAGNLCRCTGYMKIFDSVMSVEETP